MPAITNRRPITESEIEEVVQIFIDGLRDRLNAHGYGSFASSHEILGIITEEYKELTEAVQANDQGQIIHELLDLAVPAVFGIACLRTGEVEVL